MHEAEVMIINLWLVGKKEMQAIFHDVLIEEAIVYITFQDAVKCE